jgi:hypothetical protein
VRGPRSYHTRGVGNGAGDAGAARGVPDLVDPDDILLFVTEVGQDLAEDEEGQEGEGEGSEYKTESPEDYDHARAAAGEVQAKLNNSPRRFGVMGRHPNVAADAERAWLASAAEIQASEADVLRFSDETIPRDQDRSGGYTSTLNAEEAWESARRLVEREVRATMDIPDNAASRPGVWRPLSPDQVRVYEKLLRLNWPWALKYVSVVSFGKRLSIDSIPGMHVLRTSKNLVGVGASYASGPDGLAEFIVEDDTGHNTGTRGLSGNIAGARLRRSLRCTLFSVRALHRDMPLPHLPLDDD